MSLHTMTVKVQKRTTDQTYSITIPKNFTEELALEKCDIMFIKLKPRKTRFIVCKEEK